MFKDLEKYYFYTYSETVDGVQTVNIVSPGKKKEDFTIELQGSNLVVSVGGYEDRFKLTNQVELKNITAEYDAGILIVKLPRKDSEPSRKILVE
jgi:HSP20 family molecular chaperone IbpA